MGELKNSLLTLGFKPKDGKDCIYLKKYKAYEINIEYNEKNPEKSNINYGKEIVCHRHTTCNFNQEESLVVLECVDRLLNKGYKPENIELEKSWNLGHKDKGFLDVWVKDEFGNSFLMVECKTWGKEYEKFCKETFTHKNTAKENDGGQIFSYLQQEPKTTKAVCYYTSKINSKNIEYKNAIIHNKDDWSDLNQIERFKRWSKTFETNGIFDDGVPLYKLESKAIRRKDLKELKREDSDGIYNQFAEILRHNVVSDKPNAFNKIINLFLCKIWDEDRCPDDEVKFQTRTNGRDKSDEELLEDLNDLYKAGMKAYLEKDVSDCTKNDFETLLSFVGDSSKKSEFEELYKTLRLYKNNEFAFKEVYDKKSFRDNAKVVREVVELLQDKQLRYSHKQQFLGDFFEKLLNDSIKQEAGQFFTPVPLTQFIIKSLPIEEMIKTKIANGEQEVLPYVIDYACGTGHFLTEIMDTMNDIIKNNIDLSYISKPSVQREFKNWQDSDFEWAEKYIYGIDLDYRLIKASKISCFLNGDGKANLLHANGLAPFDSEDYLGKLHNPSAKQDNQKFDILIANPPYSVKTFKPTIKDGEKSFELFDGFTENSSEIECLFVERAKQLLKEGGYAGIVLPVSLLTNDKIYIRTREILLKYFDIKGILSLQNNAFMATGTKTIILLMQRRSNNYWKQIHLAIKTFLDNYKNVTVAGIEKAFSKFVEINYENLSFEDYISILKANTTESAKESEYYEEHKNISIDNLRKLEAEKMLYFFLSYNSKIVLANSGEKAEEKEFLGYEFSNSRGKEGINIYKDDENNIISSLFSSIDNSDKEKLNTYMKMSILNQENTDKIIDDINNEDSHPLTKHIDHCQLSELIEFSLPNFDITINLNAKKKVKIDSKYPIVTLGDVTDNIFIGGTPDRSKKQYYRNGNHLWLSIKDMNNGVIFDTNEKINDLGVENSNVKLVKAGTLLFSFKLSVGKTAIAGNDMYTNEAIAALMTNNLIDKKYLQIIIANKYIPLEVTSKAFGNMLNSKTIPLIKLPLPPLNIQKQITDNITIIEKSFEKNNDKINNLYEKISKLINVNNINEKIRKYANLIQRGKTPKYSYAKSDIQIIKSGQIRGVRKFDFSKKYYASSSMKADDRLLQKGDLLINSTGVGTAGRVNLFDLDGQYFVDSHVTILRLDQTRLLPVYLLYQLYFNIGFKNIEKMATGQSGQIELAPDAIANIKIPVPNIEEQKRIVAKILPLEVEIERLQKEIDEIPAKKRAILDKYLK